jgi:hypothetical protein
MGREIQNVPVSVPSINNERAIPACEKAGFQKLRQYDATYGRCWVFVAVLPQIH